jgi:hypothetical protein
MNTHELARAARALSKELAAHDPADHFEGRDAMRESGWMEAVAHLAALGGLSHAGLVEAETMLAASREWFAEVTGEEGRSL